MGPAEELFWGCGALPVVIPGAAKAAIRFPGHGSAGLSRGSGVRRLNPFPNDASLRAPCRFPVGFQSRRFPLGAAIFR
jgi:hypothetical protein